MDIHNHFYLQNEAAVPEICISQNEHESFVINILIEKKKPNQFLNKWFSRLKKFTKEEQSNFLYK